MGVLSLIYQKATAVFLSILADTKPDQRSISADVVIQVESVASLWLERKTIIAPVFGR